MGRFQDFLRQGGCGWWVEPSGTSLFNVSTLSSSVAGGGSLVIRSVSRLGSNDMRDSGKDGTGLLHSILSFTLWYAALVLTDDSYSPGRHSIRSVVFRERESISFWVPSRPMDSHSRSNMTIDVL